MWSDRRRLMLGLAGSLLLNVFLLGILFGHGFGFHGKQRPSLPPPPPIASPRLVEALPEDQKEIFRAAMAAHRPEIRAARRTHHEIRQKTMDDIAAPTFDRAKVAADLAALHQSNRESEEVMSAALLDALAGLSPASRASLVNRNTATSPPSKP